MRFSKLAAAAVAIAGCGGQIADKPPVTSTPGYFMVELESGANTQPARLWAAQRQGPDGAFLRLGANSGVFVDLPLVDAVAKGSAALDFSSQIISVPAADDEYVSHHLESIVLEQHGQSLSGSATHTAFGDAWNCLERWNVLEGGTTSLSGKPALLTAPEPVPGPVEVWPGTETVFLHLVDGPPVVVRDARRDDGGALQATINEQGFIVVSDSPYDFGTEHHLLLTLEDLAGNTHHLTWTVRVPTLPADAPDLTFASGLGGYVAENVELANTADGPKAAAHPQGILGFQVQVPEGGATLAFHISGPGELIAYARGDDGSHVSDTLGGVGPQDVSLDLSTLAGHRASVVLLFQPTQACPLAGQAAGELLLDPITFKAGE